MKLTAFRLRFMQQLMSRVMKANHTKSQTIFAVCVSNKGYEVSLRLNKLYAVIPDPEAEATGDVRVIDEDGEDYDV